MAAALGGKVALVTGGSRGIGLAVAEELLGQGIAVMIAARKQASLDAAVVALRQARPDAVVDACVAHAGEREQIEACVARTVERFGSVDILVNNAATSPYYGPLVDLDAARAEKIVAVNQLGPLYWTQAVWRASMAARGGSIVNVVSIGAFRVEHGFAFYNVTKAALVQLTRSLAHELAPGVRVNAVAPGFVKTDFSKALWEGQEEAAGTHIPLGRIGQPADVASAVGFLVGDSARWITGETLVVDGGAMVEPGPMVGLVSETGGAPR